MNPAVLIFGEASFSDFLLATVQEISDCQAAIVTTIGALEEAVWPDCPGLIVLQDAKPVGPWIEQFKQVPSHRWVYCLVIDSSIDPVPPPSPNQIHRAAGALENGTDAYCWLGSDGGMSPSTAEIRLLRAYLRKGLEHMQQHLEMARVNDLLSAIALSDGLTRLNNRRAFDWELPRQIQIAQAEELPLALLMLDIDYFKVVNDTYGHLIGDQVLQILAERLKHNLRSDETLFRYGGEEFVIILSRTHPEEALSIAQRLRSIISQQPFVIDDSLEISITLSLGLSHLTDEDDPNGISLLNRTDQNLLRAKSAGRDRIVQS